MAALIAGCSGPQVPAGVKCSAVRSGGRTSPDLSLQLGKASAGECVVAQGTAYQGNFVVPAGVRLVASEGSAVAITGADASSAAITVRGGVGSGLFGISIDSASAGGVDVIGGPAQIANLKVRRASGAAMRIVCTGADCLAEASLVEVTNPDLRDSELGLAVFGARVTVTGGAAGANTSTRLGYGYGLLAAGGAVVVLNGTQVEENLAAGVLIDGAGGTSLQLTNVKVVNNLGRGIWAQGLVGTGTAPKLVISGKQTLVDANRIVGVGATGSTGILISDAVITNTVKVKLSSALGMMEDVGDGVGLFSGTGQTRIERVALENNQRGQLVVDKGGVGIIIPDYDRVLGGDFKFVIQNTAQPVTAPPALLSDPGRELLVKTDVLAVLKP